MNESVVRKDALVEPLAGAATLPEATPARDVAGVQPLLEIRGLRRRFGGIHAVEDVSLTLRPGQTISVIGPNGSGKTTLFNLISGVLKPDGGEVIFEGRSITGLPAERIAELGIARTFQNGRVFGNMTVRENVLVGMHTKLAAARPWPSLRYKPLVRWLPLLAEMGLALVRPPRVRHEEVASEREVDRQLSRFKERLLPRKESLAFSLSYANRRRTEIARALAMAPRLLLLDEPTAGMNPTETAEVLEQIRELRQEGFSILLIEHKLDLVMALSDQVLVLDNGKLIAEGTPAEIQQDERVIAAYLGRRQAEAIEAPTVPVPVKAPERSPLLAPIEPSSPEFRGGSEELPLSPEIGGKGSGGIEGGSALLELEGIDAFYGPMQALFGVSLDVKPGEVVCLLGGNASGKSTTMKVILGLLTPKAGQVRLAGEDVTGRVTADRIRRGLASVPEARRIFPEMTVDENLLMGAFLRNDTAAMREDMDRMYELFPRLAERRRQAAGTMSGGEQQMLAMARALMSRPRLICMDEPTMGLAPIFVDRVLENISLVNQQGVSIFMVEQNAALALSIAHRGYVLQNGRIVLSGAAADLLNNPAIQEAYLGRNSQ